MKIDHYFDTYGSAPVDESVDVNCRSLRAVFSIVQPQSADWLDGWVISRPAAGLVGWVAGPAAGLLVNLARVAGVID
jgi:hypothetical protein